jgi:hypothetical protein
MADGLNCDFQTTGPDVTLRCRVEREHFVSVLGERWILDSVDESLAFY